MEPTSFLDDVGRVFHWKGEVYRGIHEPYTGLYGELFGGATAERLRAAGLVHTEIAPFRLPGFDLVLKHRTLPVVSYMHEWPSAQLKDAALLTCDLQLELLSSGYTLKDAHPCNVLFDGCRPVFVDVGSIIPASMRPNLPLNGFRHSFLIPLLLRRAGLTALAEGRDFRNRALWQHLNVRKLLLVRLPLREFVYHQVQDRRVERNWRRFPVRAIERLRRQVERIPVLVDSAHARVDRWDSAFDEANGTTVRTVAEALDRLRPRTVLDVRAGNGVYACLAADKGARVVAGDTDERRLNALFELAKRRSLDIHTVLFDLWSPTLAQRPWGVLSGAVDRLRSEGVLCMDLVHRVPRRRLLLDELAEYASRFAQKWVLIEFLGKGHPRVDASGLRTSRYSLNSLLQALSRHFGHVGVHATLGEDHWLVLGRQPLSEPGRPVG